MDEIRIYNKAIPDSRIGIFKQPEQKGIYYSKIELISFLKLREALQFCCRAFYQKNGQCELWLPT
jgi:hypothetical protein